jgi:hypothetical protein
MNKIASPQQLQAELRRLLAYAGSEMPSRKRIASELRELADRVAAKSLTIEQITELCKKKGVSPTKFWEEAMGGDRASLPKDDVDKIIRSLR